MREQLERRFFLGLLGLVSLLFFWLMQPLWGAIFWACAMAVIFYPLQHWLLTRVSRKRGRIALLTLVCSVCIVVAPLLLLGSSLVQDGVAFYGRLQSGEIDPAKQIEAIKAAFPTMVGSLQELGIDTDNLKQKLSEAAMVASRFLATQLLSIGQDAASVFLNIALMLYLMFFLLRDGPQLIRLLVAALPLGDEREYHLMAKFAEVTRATVKGNLVVAVVQGMLGGLIFWILAIPAPVLWGVVMTVLSLLPAVGAALVWLPVAIYLYAVGDMVSATILMVYGATIIGLADNVLRPILVGRDTKLPDYMVLFSTLGGISVFGLHGFVLGPLVAVLFLAFWQIFMTEFNPPAGSTLVDTVESVDAEPPQK